jgi:CheY-like chemotaxis protein
VLSHDGGFRAHYGRLLAALGFRQPATAEPADLTLIDGRMAPGPALLERLRGRRSVTLLPPGLRQPSAAVVPGTRTLRQPLSQRQLSSALATAPEATARTLSPDAPAAASAADGRTAVLLAEDNAINRKVAVRMLEKLGCSVVLAENGRQALERVSAQPFALVLMDCRMPEMDGLEATRRIRALERSQGRAQLPIVALTAHALAADRELCIAAGMNDYISKPVRLESLKQVLVRWAPAYEARRRGA